MKVLIEQTYWVKIYLSGSIKTIKEVCRKDCYEEGLCVTVDKTLFIYTGGEESGAVVGLINYPRFPTTPDKLFERARKLALLLLEESYQHSVLLMSPDKTEWITRREQ